jgi:taurine dioxygenase
METTTPPRGAQVRRADRRGGLRTEQTKAIGEGWRPDMTCFDEPPKATILFCEEVPPWGGDTQWAAMGPTFEALSAGLKATLLGLGAIHANVRKLGYR